MTILTRYDIAERLKDLRKQKRLTQAQTADAIGITRSAYGSYEEGRAEPSIPILLRFVKFYRFESIDQLLGEMPGNVQNVEHPVLKAYYRLKPDMKAIVDFILTQEKMGG